MTDTNTQANDKAVEAMVEAIFKDLRDRRFLKWLFSPLGDKCLIGNLEGEPLNGLDLEVQGEIRMAWAGILSAALPEIRRDARAEAWKPGDLVQYRGNGMTFNAQFLEYDEGWCKLAFPEGSTASVRPSRVLPRATLPEPPADKGTV